MTYQNIKKLVKKNIELRPLCCFCGLFLLLTALFLFAPTILKCTAVAVGILFFISFLLYGKYIPQAKFIFTCLAVCCLAVVLSCSVCLCTYDLSDKRSLDLALKEERVSVIAYPEDTVYESELSNCYILNVQKLNGKRVFGIRLLATFPADGTPKPFEIVRINGALSLPENSDPSFDSVSYYRSKGIFAQIHQDDTVFTGEKALSLGRPIAALTAFVEDHIDKNAKEDSSPLIKALLLGEKGDLSKELKRDFKTLGLSHLLAVSGLHLSVLFALWSFLLIRMRIPLKVRCGLLIPLALLFCALCGFSPSVLRACVMLILYLISKIVNEDSDSVTSLLFAGGLIVLFSPYAVFDVGFLLSFFSAFGILVTTPLHFGRKRKEGRIPRLFKSIANALLVSLFAQIATLPILCLTYGSFSLLSVPATLLFAPLISLILYLAPIALILSFIPGLSSLLFLLLEAICTVVIRLSSLAIYVKEGLVSTEHPLAIPLLGLLLCGVVYLLPAKKKRPAIAVLAGCYLLFSSLCFLYPRFEKPLILADTYGKNDLFVLYDHGESLIVDLSDGSKGALERSLYLLFDNTLDQTPDALLLTHYHKRHVSSFRSLCQEYYPKRLYLCRPITDEETAVFDELLLLAKQRSVAVTVIEEEQSLSFGRYTLSDFYREYLPRSTHPILSFTVNEGCHRFCYLSSSALEGSFYPEEQILYMGVHGPVIKKQLPEQLLRAFSLVFASPSLLEDYEYPHGIVKERTDTSCFVGTLPASFGDEE